MATFAPSSCRRLAVARPMPLLPPVMTATLPSKRFIRKNLQICGRRAPAEARRQKQLRYLDERLNKRLRRKTKKSWGSCSLLKSQQIGGDGAAWLFQID